MTTRFSRFILEYPGRLVMPIGVYGGLAITGASVRQAVSDPHAQSEAVLALHEKLHTPVMLTAMDLSAESEAFGCTIRMEEEEIPTVIGRLVKTSEETAALKVPLVGEKRTRVHLDTAGQLVKAHPGTPVLGGLIGPFSLAARLFGVSETLETTAVDPDLVHSLLEKATAFLTAYTQAFAAAGAWGVIMAEPAAGLLSPRSLSTFSAAYVRRIIEAVKTPNFTVVLHNCGAKIVHLPKVLESEAEIYHFGAPMDLPAAFAQIGDSPILCGNLDPSAVFHSGTADDVRREAKALLQAVGPRKNFVLSSGCDIPPGTPIENLEALYAAARG
ncbi:MAG TPA: uroporphyrinogen decarboxylase family protein [Longilinea sp.]|nr:uroporphyrinogen decarboxylase family protein [Longilinea sp.]